MSKIVAIGLPDHPNLKGKLSAKEETFKNPRCQNGVGEDFWES